jgi:hypothetical protein
VGIAHLPGLAHTGLTERTARRDLSKLAVGPSGPGCGGREGDDLAAGRRGLGFAVVLADAEQAPCTRGIAAEMPLNGIAATGPGSPADVTEVSHGG